MRRLALFFDGTWNNFKSHTNVSLLKSKVVEGPAGDDGVEQVCFYDAGVGTTAETKLAGGLFGMGLSENIRQGYAWLSRKYQDGDQIFVFGFSRGAYTARSLVGLIRKCGLLRDVTEARVAEAYEIYRQKDLTPDGPRAVEFRRDHSREVRVHFIGVWDTVGALGIPLTRVPLPFFRSYYQFHDTELSGIVDYAYHAVAVDENRQDYAPTLWTNQPKPTNREVQQRWFAGAHADVGGGYDDDDRLRYIPLRWIQEQAAARGLAFSEMFDPAADAYVATIHDSFKTFMLGLYRVIKFGHRYFRPIGGALNEVVDQTVQRRRDDRGDYRPPSLPE